MRHGSQRVDPEAPGLAAAGPGSVGRGTGPRPTAKATLRGAQRLATRTRMPVSGNVPNVRKFFEASFCLKKKHREARRNNKNKRKDQETNLATAFFGWPIKGVDLCFGHADLRLPPHRQKEAENTRVDTDLGLPKQLDEDSEPKDGKESRQVSKDEARSHMVVVGKRFPMFDLIVV